MINLGLRIKNLRLEKGLTQEQFAIRLGVTKSIISAYESGVRHPSLDMLVKISQSFNVTTDFLLGLNKNLELNVSGLSSEQISILRALIEQFSK